MTTPIIDGHELGKVICEAMDLDPNKVARIILDCPAHGLVALYIQMWGSAELLDVDWGAELKGVKVVKLTE